jgi:cellulose synthase/poly-beta-1,6-N-acetylglucosamine synthase-like glycosyltransferase
MSYQKSSKSGTEPEGEMPLDWPVVTVQLPVYNELYVVERLIDTVAQLEYPKDKLEIQVLDDSNDESVEVAAQCIAKWQKEGINIKHIRRPDRIGYKAPLPLFLMLILFLEKISFCAPCRISQSPK